MIALNILAQVAQEAPAWGPIQNLQEIGAKTGFSYQHLLSQIIAFLIVAGILQKFAFKHVREILEQRRKTIEEAMANAEQIKKELADAETTRLDIIHKAGEQANRIIAEAEKSAAIIAEQRAKEATRQAEDIIKNAHEASVLDRDRLMEELKRHLGELVIQTTEKVAGKILTAEDQARLNTETLRQLGAGNN